MSLVMAAALGGRSAAQAAPLHVEVLQTGPGSLYADMALITGERGAVLVDAPFTRADAYRVLAAVIESGKTLETIFITHDHPDHFFSVEVLTDAFPDARVVASGQVVEDIWKSIPLKLKRWGPLLGRNGPRHPMAPTAPEQDHFELEGPRFDALVPTQ